MLQVSAFGVFLCGFVLGFVLGIIGIVVVALLYNKGDKNNGGK